jgi:hypothetical protein
MNIPSTVLIDEEDRQKLESFGKWCISSKGYCARTDNKNKKTILMHRIIMNCPDNMVVDHVNHNPLDNRKENLRIVTMQQNNYNRTSKGYSWNKQRKKWIAQIRINKKQTNLGGFDTEEEAKNAYLSAKKLFHIIGENV